MAGQRAHDVVGVEVFHTDGALDQARIIAIVKVSCASDVGRQVGVAPDVRIAFFESVEDVCPDLDPICFELALFKLG